MKFAVFVLRDDPDVAIFDIALRDTTIKDAETSVIVHNRHEYDCVAVFEVSDDRARFHRLPHSEGIIIGIVGEWAFNAQELLASEAPFREFEGGAPTGNEAPITRLWFDE